MTFPRPKDPLLAAGQLLAMLMQGLMALAAVGVTLAIPVMFVFKDEIQADLITEHGPEIAAFPVFTMAGIALLALALIAAAFIFFGKLRAIINSVSDSDPFVPENADRLSTMAWLFFGAHLLIGAIAALALSLRDWAEQMGDDVTVSHGFDLTSVLIVILLFILARIFRQGTAMRADLEGTV